MRCVIAYSLALLVLAPAAQAGVWLEGTGTTILSTNNQALGSASVGYAFPQGFVLAAEGLTSINGWTAEHTWAIGPKGGLLIQGFELSAAYLPFAYDYEGASTFQGGGFTLNLGYTFPIFRGFRAGLLATYSLESFTSENGQNLPTPRSLTQFAPQVAITIEI